MLSIWVLVSGLGDLGRIDEIESAADAGYQLAETSAEASHLRLPLAVVLRHRVPTRGCADVAGRHDHAYSARHDRCSVSAGVAQPLRRPVGDESRRSPCRATFAARNDRTSGKRRRRADDEDLRAIVAGGRDRHGRQSGRRSTRVRGHRVVAPRRRSVARGTSSDSSPRHGRAPPKARRRRRSRSSVTRRPRSLERGRPAWEVVLLQTATQFGDHTTAARLAELEDQVQGPRAPAAAAHATALAAGSGDALVDASRQYEAFGDRIAAADAAAQAVVAYQTAGSRGAAMSAFATAQRLAAECHGAQTPALRAATTPQPSPPGSAKSSRSPHKGYRIRRSPTGSRCRSARSKGTCSAPPNASEPTAANS